MPSDEQAIREVIATWMTATKAGDNARVLSLMSEDVIFLAPGRPPMRGKAAFAEAQGGLKDVEIDGRCEVQEIKVAGEWAWGWTDITVKITPRGGKPMTRAGNTLSVFKKENGKWLLYRDANLLAAQ